MDFRGARASNAGDDYHELWVTRQAIRLLGDDSELKAIAVEGVSESDASGQPADTWSGVDCTLYFGGTTDADATRVDIVQVKYSTTQPQKKWTAARLAQGGKRKSVLSRLAKAWKGVVESRPRDVHVTTTLVSNQPLQPNLERTVRGIATASATATKDTSEVRLARVADLDAKELREFASSLSFKCGAGSRIALEEQVLQSIGKWTDHDLRQVAADIQDFIRRKMMPEATGEPITRESVLAHLGVSDKSALFPCPSEIELVANPVRRAAVTAASAELRESQYVCLHGEAGVGKTTALQEIETDLPPGSIMLKYDCYGAGRYSDPSALRHRTRDAILQLTNELAVRLALPLLLPPSAHTDYMRQFMRRLENAATTLRRRSPEAVVVIAIDAADNAVFAAEGRRPPESSFVADFVKLTNVPANVRLIITARTGRRDCLQLPPNYKEIQIERFSQRETVEFVSRAWRSAPWTWIEEFHHLSIGNPRVQATAIAFAGEEPKDAIRRLMPNGKSLKDIFDESFREAMQKSGARSTLTSFCAAVIALPRPVPLAILARILKERESVVLDICLDLAPSIMCRDDLITFADEDLEEFVRAAGAASMDVVQDEVARLMQRLRKDDQYAASHVAAALLAAGHRSELLDLVRREPAPPAGVISDSSVRREVELRRLQLAISVCREAKDVEEALRFILRGAESIQTESALHSLLTENPDLAVRFAPEAVRRLVLLDPSLVEDQGRFLFHHLAADASSGDAISERQGRRKVQAWLEARDTHRLRARSPHDVWEIEVGDISSMVEATLKLRGAGPALEDLGTWRPRHVRVEIGLTAPWRLVAEGYGGALATLVREELSPVESLYALVPLAMSGEDVDTACIEEGLRTLLRRRHSYDIGADEYGPSLSLRGRVVGLLLTAAEILIAKGTAIDVVKDVLAAVLDGSLSQIKSHAEYRSGKLDLLLRAHTLREVLNGRKPTVANLFDAGKGEEPGGRQSARDDQGVRGIAGAAISAYTTVATALVARAAIALDDDTICFSDSWVISSYGGDGLKGRLAAHVSILALVGCDLDGIWRTALRVHGDWREGLAAPDEDFVARFRLWPALHGPLVERIGTAAKRAHSVRIAAREKTDLLVRYSRALLPISHPDAGAVFASAVEVVGDLDVEIMGEIDFFRSLVTRCARSQFAFPRRTAMQFAGVVEEAGLRLLGCRHFPWDAAMGALTELDPPSALAHSARWSDENLVHISTTLPPLLSAAMSARGIRPQQASALALFLDSESSIGPEIIACADRWALPSLSEEVARDTVVRGAGDPQVVLRRIGPDRHGRWTDALRRQVMFQKSLPQKTAPEKLPTKETEEVDDGLSGHGWKQNELIDANCLEQAIFELRAATVDHQRPRPRAILDAARIDVKPPNRVAHLDALSKLSLAGALADDVPQALLNAVSAWSHTPSVAHWAHTILPGVVRDRFNDFALYRPHSDLLERALDLTDLDEQRRREIILQGLETSVGALPVATILALVELVSRGLHQRGAARIATWYAGHLAGRIAEDGRVGAQTADWPRNLDEAMARYLFAHLGDCDQRLRWRAAHAVRRLARTDDLATIDALRREYFRKEDREFRSKDAPFYWLAARLWFVIAFDGVARDRPKVAARAADLLLEVALDDSLPHVLVQSFARDACVGLAEKRLLSLSDAQCDQLETVDASLLPRKRRATRSEFGSEFDHWGHKHRFDFSVVDTLPYWYKPMLRSFAELDARTFLCAVERWIVDEWRFDGDIWKADEGREGRFLEDRALTMNSHGTIPTIERLRSYLEWHAMWCATGRLLKHEPLAEPEYAGDGLSREIASAKLVAPPIWSADLRGSTPLEGRYWQVSVEPLDSWIKETVDVHLTSLFAADPPGYLVVNERSRRKMTDRVEAVEIHSALVTHDTGRSLVRALQTMDDNWDYAIPFEEDTMETEIEASPFRFLGWLRGASYDGGSGIDMKDPFAACGFGLRARPGKRVEKACRLRSHGIPPVWVSGDLEEPMFVYQTWGKPEDWKSDHSGFVVSGYRLLAHKEQLRHFLHDSKWDLIVEVEVTRSDRKERRFSRDGENEGSRRTARVYRFDGDGRCEDAGGRVDTWSGDCGGARSARAGSNA